MNRGTIMNAIKEPTIRDLFSSPSVVPAASSASAPFTAVNKANARKIRTKKAVTVRIRTCSDNTRKTVIIKPENQMMR